MDNFKCFLHLANTLHFGRSSKDLEISTSSLSRVIQRLEEEVGQVLFLRNRRNVQLTQAGLAYRKYAMEALENWERLQEQLKEDAPLEGEISLFCSVTACYSVLPEILQNFRAQFPRVKVKLLTGDPAMSIGLVLEKKVDFAITALPETIDEALEQQTITYTPLIFIAPVVNCEVKSILKKSEIDWSRVPMVFPESGLIKLRLEDWFRAKGIEPKIYGSVAGHEAILSLVSLGFGAGVIPQIVLEKSLMQNNVEVLPAVEPRLKDFQVAMCARRNLLKNPVIKAFWDSFASTYSRV